MIGRIVLILRLALGSVFIFSGGVKLIDPQGTKIKLEEYFTAFSSISSYYEIPILESLFDSLKTVAIGLSLGLSSLEVVLGFAIITWFLPKLTNTTTTLLLIFFGLLTGYSASCDPSNIYGVSCVTDCGCFGDFMKLKPINSFYKDLFLLVLSVPITLYAFKTGSKIKSTHAIGGLTIISILSLSFGIYNNVNLPIIDFRPYKIGNNIIELRSNGKPAEIAYVMEKDGKEETFTEYPFEQGYNFVRTEITTEATEPTAKDFYLYNQDGEDETEQILKDTTVFIISQGVQDIEQKEANSINELIKKLEKSSLNWAILSSSSKKEFQLKGINLPPEISFYSLDQTVTKAIIRSNPGVMVIEQGIVKFKSNDLNSLDLKSLSSQ